MRNLEQIRAANALAYVRAGLNLHGQQGGNVLNKVPALIMGNGLMATGAFAMSQKDGGWKNCFNHIAQHLAHTEIGIAPNQTTLEKLMDFLSQSDSQVLKLATEESLAWLAFARRFEKSNGGTNDSAC